MLKEEFKQPVFCWAQMKRPPVARHAMRILIHGNFSVGKRAFGSHATRPTQQGADARNHMLHRERLGDVIIRADIKRAYRILVFRAGSHHDDGQITCFRTAADLAADLDARKRRQHPIQQQDIRPRFGHTQQRFLAICGFIHAEALLFQIVAQQGQQRRLIFHDQHRGLGEVAVVFCHHVHA